MKKTTYKNYPNPVLWKGNVRVLPLIHSEIMPVHEVIKAGTLINLDTPLIQKSGKVYEAVTAGTAVKVYKEHSFGVGDSLMDGAIERTISAIDTTTSADYDTLTVDDVVTFTLDEVIGNNFTAGDSVCVVTDTCWFDATDDANEVAVNVTDFAVLSKPKMPNYYAPGTSFVYGIKIVDDDIQ